MGNGWTRDVSEAHEVLFVILLYADIIKCKSLVCSLYKLNPLEGIRQYGYNV